MNDPDPETRHRAARSAEAWLVGGRRYRNSATAFWRGLLEDLPARFPGCNRAELETTGEGRLHPGLLAPAAGLAGALETDRTAEAIAGEIRELVAGLELTGPPSTVTLTVFRHEIRAGVAPELVEGVDAEVFLYLAAWLLEWSQTPHESWNRENTEGAFSVRFPAARQTRRIAFSLGNRHLSEGLYERILDLRL